ncbi:MAG: ferrous iron transport protein B [Oscillospiraceae bacterium]|nr:ferrous iron transport protein B [Oscillospiraceae bacterium]
MGLTGRSTGWNVIEDGLTVRKEHPEDRVIALAGNPNVGKSTVFNRLTGLHQHTGNWPGKTVTNAVGRCEYRGKGFLLVDVPGCYSLMAHSCEEEVARDFICFGGAEGVVVVCDGTCLERNCNLLLQTLEVTRSVVVCVNLMDEAKKKGLEVDTALLSRELGIPVVPAAARNGKGLDTLLAELDRLPCAGVPEPPVRYALWAEEVLKAVEEKLRPLSLRGLPGRWVAARLLDGEESLWPAMEGFLGFDLRESDEGKAGFAAGRERIEAQGKTLQDFRDEMAAGLVRRAKELAARAVGRNKGDPTLRDRRIDRWITGKWVGFPLMLLLLMGVFWLTVVGANYPSQLLSQGIFWVEEQGAALFRETGCPEWFVELLFHGVYRTVGWVVSVMLPPMAIFFPLFTLLEDLGYLPRVAFNLDRAFQKCSACGKQALTMCMGLGCNAAGVVGCRIIDSPRERLLAILTNNFVPCNGRFPTILTLIALFFLGGAATPFSSLLSAALLVVLLLVGVGATFGVSRLLSATLLKGVPSSFTLELPPYRMPRVGQVLVRSVLDRTLFVLGRAVTAAAPAGLLLWLMANLQVGEVSVLTWCCGVLDPAARLIGLDGAILVAFILGIPANEIVLPIILMIYTSGGMLTEPSGTETLFAILTQNGWTVTTALCTILFSLLHWPCATTLMTIRKETQSIKWTVAAFLIPTLVGVLVCFIVARVGSILGM